MPSKKKKKEPEPEPVEDDDEDVIDDEEHEEEDEDNEAENGGDDNDDDEDDEEEADDSCETQDSAERIKKLKAQRRNARAKARQLGYRKWAHRAGMCIGSHSFSNNIMKTVFSAADIVRMAKWAPQTGDVGMDLDEFKTRVFLRDQPLSSGPTAVLHANVESFARNICKEVSMRCIENGQSRITAAHVQSVLRPYKSVLDLDFMAPLGAIRHAQRTETGRQDDEGNPIYYLLKKDDDDALAESDKKISKQNHSKILKNADAELEDLRLKRAQKKRKRNAKNDEDEKVVAKATASV
tara:strand:- start:80 stop:964 length:885 start_codon:yes stop_codon:yes gene_type:complete